MATRNQSLSKACPLEGALDLIGGKWKGMIVYYLLNGKMRFNELQRAIPVISQRMLSRQLKQLEEDGLLVRTVNADGPLKVEYHLSQYGMGLKPILLELRAWGAGLKTEKL